MTTSHLAAANAFIACGDDEQCTMHSC